MFGPSSFGSTPPGDRIRESQPAKIVGQLVHATWNPREAHGQASVAFRVTQVAAEAQRTLR